MSFEAKNLCDKTLLLINHTRTLRNRFFEDLVSFLDRQNSSSKHQRRYERVCQETQRQRLAPIGNGIGRKIKGRLNKFSTLSCSEQLQSFVFLLSLTKQTVFIGKMYIKRKCDMVKCNLVSYFCHHHYTSFISFLSRNVSINNVHFSAPEGARDVQLLKPVPDGGF